MRHRLLAVVVMGVVSTISARALPSDHADSPNGSKDPTADITDVFLFTSPETPGRLVVALNVNPGAFNNALFSDAVTYSIRLRTNDKGRPPRELRIDCVFDLAPASGTQGAPPKQIATCTGYDFDPTTNRLSRRIGGKPTVVNESTDGNDGLRIFTGMRADSWHIDAPGSLPALRGEGWKYTTGKNTLAMLDVQSIVVEVDVARLFAGTKRFKAAGETTMRLKP